jgi:hypothetical protein
MLSMRWINKTYLCADWVKGQKIKYLAKFISHIAKIHNFEVQGSISDTSMRAALEREAKITDIYQRWCYHYVERIKLIFAPTELRSKN